jgi:hypothetical protein
MSDNSFWNPVRNPDMSGFSRNFGLWINFDILHFTNSPNAPPHPLDSRELLELK